MSAKYTLICHDKHPVSTITVEIETCSLNVLVSISNRYRDWETDRKSTRLNSSH